MPLESIYDATLTMSHIINQSPSEANLSSLTASLASDQNQKSNFVDPGNPA